MSQLQFFRDSFATYLQCKKQSEGTRADRELHQRQRMIISFVGHYGFEVKYSEDKTSFCLDGITFTSELVNDGGYESWYMRLSKGESFALLHSADINSDLALGAAIKKLETT